jgi:hypothetical protein
MQHFTAKLPLINMTHRSLTIPRTAWLWIMTILFAFGLHISQSRAQTYSYTETQNLTVLDSSSQELIYALCGGFNQAQFVSIDIDNDGTKDVMVYDRTGRKILPFINEPGGLKYHPEYESCFPEIETWVVGTDFNADQKTDLWFSKYGNIALYKNATKPSDLKVRFVKVSDELRGYNFNAEPGGIDTTSLYSSQFNQPAIADVDLDGDIDVLTLQPFGYGITLFLNNTVETGKPLDPPSFEEVDFCWGDFEEALNNDSIYLRRNQYCYGANYRYKKKHSGGSSLLLIDKDNDKDMDLIIGNAGFDNIIMIENGKTDFSKKCDSMISYDLQYPISKPARLDQYPASFYLDVDNDGLKDLVVASSLADFSSGLSRETNQIWFYKNEGTADVPDFKHKSDDFMVGQSVDYGGHCVPVLYDIDKDGDFDLFLATNGDYFLTQDSSDRIVFLRNVGTAKKPIFQEEDTDFLSLSTKGYMNLNFSIGNIDGDSVLDLIIGKVNGNIDWYNIVKTGPTYTLKEVKTDAFGVMVNEASAPSIVDVDKDNLPDLLVGSYGGNTYYYKNTGTSTSPVMTFQTDTFGKVISNGKSWTTSGDTGNDTLVYDYDGYGIPRLMDMNGDGNRELILGSKDGTLKVFDQVEGNLTGTFQEIHGLYFDPLTKLCIQKDFGNRSAAAIADLNDDGKMDIIVGNSRGGIHYLEGVDTNCLLSISDDNVSLQRHINVYPNPTSDLIHIEKNQDITILELELYDLKGNKVISKHKDLGSISLKHLPAGVYSLGIISNYGKSYKKIIKYN